MSRNCERSNLGQLQLSALRGGELLAARTENETGYAC